MGQKIHRKDEPDRRRHAREDAATGEADPERRRHHRDNETGPGQRPSVLQLGAKRGEQGLGKIRVETQILAQLGDAEKLRPDVGAAQAIGGLAPAGNRQGRNQFFIRDVSCRVVIHHFCPFQPPVFRRRLVKGIGRDIVPNDIFLRILLHDLHAAELVRVRPKARDVPGAVVGPVAEDLTVDHHVAQSAAIDLRRRNFSGPARRARRESNSRRT